LTCSGNKVCDKLFASGGLLKKCSNYPYEDGFNVSI
jgi:hypothetical protein